jgi:parallel beta-helix repeat protein
MSHKNDCTHGGEGIFIRSLNGWVSTGNIFEENDCSFANNNGFEAWCPRNVYRRNRANHCSYGFWLGASDQTRLEDNEASFNGDPKGDHNSPHLPNDGHAGIVFMFGPSSHTVARGNTCRGNHGAGIALVGDLETAGRKWKAYHWIIEQNRLIGNRWGVYVQHADWVDMAANVYGDNSDGDFHSSGNVTRLRVNPRIPMVDSPPRAVLQGPTEARVGQKVTFDATASSDPQACPLQFAWELGDGTRAESRRVEHVFTTPGFHRLGLTVSNGSLSELAWRDLYVVDDAKEIGTEGQSGRWKGVDPQSRVTFCDDRETRISGRSSIYALVRPYSGGRVSLLYPATSNAGWSLSGRSRIVFWVKAITEDHVGWQNANPVVTLHDANGQVVVITPKVDLLSHRPNNEEREGWSRFEVPLAGDSRWSRSGAYKITTVVHLTIGFDSWGASPLRIWIDGLSIQ